MFKNRLRMKIDSTEETIGSILRGNYYKIPRFQRPYSWDRENVEELWQDIFFGRGVDYFIGSIVVYEDEIEDKYGIVDGQQRLTTITMILCAIRNLFKENGSDELAFGVHRLIEREDIDNKSQYVLQTETSYPYLQEYIQKFGNGGEIECMEKEEERDLKQAFEIITDKLEKAVDSIREDTTLDEERKRNAIEEKLIEIRDKTLKLKMIFIKIDEEDDAYVVFETLNTRGKDLTVADLVKNHITKLIKVKNINVDIPKEKWNRILEIIGGSEAEIDINTFLHHYWLSKHDYTTAKNLFKEIKNHVKTPDNAKLFLEELLKDVVTYREIHETSFRKWDRSEKAIRGSLEALNLFRVKQPLPMVLSIMREYREGRLKPKHVRDILEDIENFHFRFTAVTSQRSSGGISLMYAGHARRLLAAEKPKEKLRVISELRTKLRQKGPPYREFEVDYLEIHYSAQYKKQKNLVHYILSKVDGHWRKACDKGTEVDYAQMTIEHLTPQSPSRPSKVSHETIAKIGNLLLVSGKLNERLDNKTFPQKKKILVDSDVWLGEVVTEASKWGEKEIDERSKELSRLAYYKVWKI